MKQLVISPEALQHLYLFKSGQQNLVFKIFELLTDIQKNPFTGIGKPEPLKGNYKSYWSRRINDEHRVIYRVTTDVIEIVSCYGHYT